jgi:LuxR family transcriptional regulator of csgAB operon
MSSGLHVNIIGPRYLANSRLADFLEENTPASCSVHDADKEMVLDKNQDTRVLLTLLDGSRQQPGYYPLDTYNQCRQQLGNANMYAFFNCKADSELEMLAATLDIQGLFYAEAGNENLSKGVQAIFEGELWLPRRVITAQLLRSKANRTPLSHTSQHHELLTNREIEILNLLATGAKNTDIAQDLSLSVHTIKTHIYHIYKKIDVSNRMQAVNWASQNL